MGSIVVSSLFLIHVKLRSGLQAVFNIRDLRTMWMKYGGHGCPAKRCKELGKIGQR